MIKHINALSPNIGHVVVYTNSALLQYELQKMLKEKVGCVEETTINIVETKEMQSLKASLLTPPFWGGKWFVDIDVEKVGLSEVGKSLGVISPYVMRVYWINNYKQFKQLKDMRVCKTNQNYIHFLYMGKLSRDCVYRLKDCYGIDDELGDKQLRYVLKTYLREPNSVCRLFKSVKGGTQIRSNEDIIDLVGVGGNTIDNLLVKILTTKYYSERGLRMVVRARIKLLKDLSITYKYSTIKNIMLSNIDTLIEIKQLQIRGLQNILTTTIPDYLDEKKIQRLLKYETKLRDEISLPMLLNLRICLQNNEYGDEESKLVYGIYKYILSRNSKVMEIESINKKSER